MRTSRLDPSMNACSISTISVREAIHKVFNTPRKSRVCARKRFTTLEHAKTAAYSMSVRLQKHVMPEPCGHCGGYHLRAN